MDKFDYGERGYGFAFHDCGKNFGMLIIIIIIINLINVDVENCGSSKSFGFIYIYIYIYRYRLPKLLTFSFIKFSNVDI